MTSRFLILAFLLAAAGAYAQQPTNPALLGTGPLTQEGATRSNQLSYGVTSSTAYDDSVQGSPGQRNLTGSIQPQVTLSINRPRVQTNLYYGPTFTYSSDIASQSGTSHAVGGEFEYFFSKRFTINFREAFVDTSNPIDSFQASNQLPGLGILERPTDVFVGARVHRRTEEAGSDAIYRLARHTSFGVGGSFSSSTYQTLNEATAASDQHIQTQSWSAHSFISQQLTPRYSIGANYSAQNFSSDTGIGSTLAHSVLGFGTVSLKPNVQWSVFAGPEFLLVDYGTRNAPPESQATTLSYGSSLSWQVEHNGLNASFVQRVSDSGLSGGAAARARMIDFRATRQLTRRVGINLFASYMSSSELIASTQSLLPDSVTGGFGVSRLITPTLRIGLQAFRQEFLGPAPQLSGFSSHDVVSFSISYSFERPIGR